MVGRVGGSGRGDARPFARGHSVEEVERPPPLSAPPARRDGRVDRNYVRRQRSISTLLSLLVLILLALLLPLLLLLRLLVVVLLLAIVRVRLHLLKQR